MIPQSMNDLGGIQPVHVWYTLVAAATGVMTFLWRIARGIKKTNDIMAKFMMEHEMLIAWYCEKNNISVDQLPTRLKGLYKL